MYIVKNNGKRVYLNFQASGETTPPVVSPETGLVVNSYTAGEVLGGQRLVMLKEGKAFHFDPSDETNCGREIGFTKTSALLNDPVDVVRAGELTGMSLESGAIYYASPNGLITTSLPSSGIFIRAGVAKNVTTLSIKFSEPIIIN